MEETNFERKFKKTITSELNSFICSISVKSNEFTKNAKKNPLKLYFLKRKYKKKLELQNLRNTNLIEKLDNFELANIALDREKSKKLLKFQKEFLVKQKNKIKVKIRDLSKDYQLDDVLL